MLKRLRLTTMNEKVLFLAIVLHFAAISESRVIVPSTEDESFGNEEIPYSMNPLESETCGPNEVYSDCVNACNDCQTRNIPCNFLVCNKGCDCRPGYTRNDQRICIPENQCLPGKKLNPSSVDNNYNDYYEGIPTINRTPYNDYNEPDMDDNLPGTKPERFPSGAERPQKNPKEDEGIDKPDDKNFNKPIDKEDSDEFDNKDKDLGPSLDEDKPIHEEDGDELDISEAGLEESEEDKKYKEHKPEEEKPDEEKKEEEEENEVKPDEEKKEEEENGINPDEEKKEEENQEKPNEEKEGEELDQEKPDEKERKEEENEEKPDEEKKEEEEDQEKPDEGKEDELDEEKPDEERKVEEEGNNELDDNNKKHVTDDDNEEDKIPKEVDEETDENDNKNEDGISQEGNTGFFKGGSIFDTPFFNLEKVKKYFSKLDRALGHVFRQTVDEALLLNGTYANTTEEEVDIDGKKYIITKSVIKGADNYSSMYIESLSAKPKIDDTKGVEDIEIKNLTQT